MDKPYIKHLRIASERASTNPEVASANALTALAFLLEEILYGRS